MYLSHAALARILTGLRRIGRNDGKHRQERVSGLSRFLGCAELLQNNGQNPVSLSIETEGRAALIPAIGRVVIVGGPAQFTPDFCGLDNSADFNTSSNFLTRAVADSRDRQLPSPRRPPPLLMLDNEAASLHPQYQDNLREHYAFDDIKNALALWLMRDVDFGNDTVGDAVILRVNRDLAARYGQAVADLMVLTQDSYADAVQGVTDIFAPARPDILDLFDGVVDVAVDAALANPATTGRNLIIYGAPGTGKSHKVKAMAGTRNLVQTVFHPDTQNSDFFGCLKPGMRKKKVTYSFAPGPFCKALRAALLDPDHQYHLVIDELNRAPAAAVFGELFQLLDREDTGESTYRVDFPNAESQDWMRADDGPDIDRLYLPANLSILATMNSADQGVYPLDTAFRRRWEQDYLPLYVGAGPQGMIDFTDTALTPRRITWRAFVECLNDWLTLNFDIAEDRLLGLWFVKEREFNGAVPAKIMLYLWDDLLRHEGARRSLVFDQSLKTYGKLDLAVKAGTPVFAAGFLAQLEAAALQNPDADEIAVDAAPQ